ncbi:MAG: MBL fold metallo-hydrolase RNA specificity domain-containing protein, partial [archaeon]|nr:MBL fold metallo-hydrolase RNA specificity domain-containing protein [archaeon]
IRITFYNAGHNIGSSLVHMHIGNGLHNFLYTGDFNFETSNLLATAATKFPRLESVMMESTYGKSANVGLSRHESEKILIDVIKETAEKEGKILMPVLGVGRSQEIMLILERAMHEGLIPKMPIYIQGMMWDVTAIHTAYPDFFNAKVKKSIFQRDENPFLSDCFKRVVSQKEMAEVVDSKGPYIIMATSGMLTGGASLSYFKQLSENPKNTLVLTCYQGQGSLGRRLEDGEREFSFIEGGSKRNEALKCLMRVEVIKGFSGHSNFRQLSSWVQSLEPRPKKVIVVHGEYSAAIEFASAVYQQNRIETNSPKNLEVIRLR